MLNYIDIYLNFFYRPIIAYNRNDPGCSVSSVVCLKSSLSFRASDRGSTPAAGCAIYESQEMGYLFNDRPLSPNSIIWYWLHLKLGSKLVHLYETPAPSSQILQLGWHEAEGLSTEISARSRSI